MEERDDVIAGQEHAVERAHGGDEMIAGVRREQGIDHGIHRLPIDAGIIEGPLGAGGLAAPAEGLLIAGRQRCRPEILDHVEVVGLLAPLILGGVNLADSGVDSYLFQGARIGEDEALLAARRGQNLEADRLVGLAVD